MTLRACVLAAALAAMLGSPAALAQSQPPAPDAGAQQGPFGLPRNPLVEDMLRQPGEVLRPPADIGTAQPPAGRPGSPPQPALDVASLPAEDQPERTPSELPPQFQRQLVDYNTSEPAGTIVIDTSNTYLYLVRGGGKAMRYGIGVGREGFTWAGTERVSRMADWPDWHPPAEMIERQPYLPRFMAGGEGNPLGARALYLGKTLYRIHGTNQPSTIGTFVSSGCVRLVNADIEDLYSRVQVGARVVVLPANNDAKAASDRAAVSRAPQPVH
jgi:lipoprotein-anchoring transpeptidase ErfK/SrfK